MTDSHAHLIERIIAWAEADGNIRAVIVTGSSTRGPDAADRFSDRDVEIIARDQEPLLQVNVAMPTTNAAIPCSLAWN